MCQHFPSWLLMKMSVSLTERLFDNVQGPRDAPKANPGDASEPLKEDPKKEPTDEETPAALGSQGTSQPETPTRNKSRCWWCCCCTCCCSTHGKTNDANGPTRNSNNSEILNYEGDQTYNEDDILSWGRSFDKLMRSTAGRNIFRHFLKCEYSEENILFWLACEELKRVDNPETVEEMARIIYEDYISILSPKEVSLDAQARDVVNSNMKKPTPHTFDEAQLQIYTLMHRDSYPRFLNSPLYKSLLQPEKEEVEPPD